MLEIKHSKTSNKGFVKLQNKETIINMYAIGFYKKYLLHSKRLELLLALISKLIIHLVVI